MIILVSNGCDYTEIEGMIITMLVEKNAIFQDNKDEWIKLFIGNDSFYVDTSTKVTLSA